MNRGFEPVYDCNSKILILGSFPSVKSLKKGFYYGNKQNRFWKTMSKIFDKEILDDIESKKEFLLNNNIALYDVFIETDNVDSSDKNLEGSNNQLSQFSFLLPPCTQVCKILCNGKLAYKTFINNFKTNIPVIYLSSTSPANPRFNFCEWESELRFLTKS